MKLILSKHGGTTRAVTCLRLLIAAALLAAATSSGAIAVAGTCVGGIRPQDEIILVNVRPACGCCDPAVLAETVQVESYLASDESGSRGWQASDLASAVGGDPSASTIIFVHGNRLTNWDAKCEGIAAYRRIVQQVTDDAPIRFIIYSWPSAQISGPLKDVRVKAARTRPAGCQLAWLVDQLSPQTPITMVGFSYGARIITGSLHVLGGGSLGGLSLAVQHPDRQPVNAVLLASALNSDWLCPGHYHGQAMTMVHQMVLVNNCEDRAMKYYRFSSTCGNPQALGYCGPTCIDPLGASKITEMNASRYVGSEHNLFCYLSTPGVTSEIGQMASAGGAVVAAY